MLELLAMLKKGHCDGLKVRTGRLQNLISSSCIGMFRPRNWRQSQLVVTLSCVIYIAEHLDFMNQVDLKQLNIQPFGQVHHDYIGYQSLTDVPKAIAYSEAEFDVSQFKQIKSTVELIETLRCVEGLHAQVYILGLIQQRESHEFVVDNRTGKVSPGCFS